MCARKKRLIPDMFILAFYFDYEFSCRIINSFKTKIDFFSSKIEILVLNERIVKITGFGQNRNFAENRMLENIYFRQTKKVWSKSKCG